MSPTTSAERVRIDLAERSYDILIGSGLLDDPRSYDGLPSAAHAVIVSNTTVAPLYGRRLAAALGARYRRLLVVELPDGEAHKDWASLNRIFDALLADGCDRKTVLFALGGGVVGDGVDRPEHVGDPGERDDLRVLVDQAVGLGEIEVAVVGQPVARLRAVLERAGLPVRAPALGAERYLQLMRLDKKAEGGAIRFVVIEAPGRAGVREAPDALVREVIEAHGG